VRALLVTLGAISSLLVAGPPAAQAASAGAAQQTLRSALRHGLAAAGGSSGAYVVDLNTSRPLFAAAAGVRRLPASVEKLYTTSTALLRFGADSSLTTSVFGQGVRGPDGTWYGTLYLRGGGDPTFGSASFDAYAYGTGATIQRLVARLLRSSGITAVNGRIVGDESYFDSRRGTAESGYHFDPYMEGSLSALAFNRGLTGGGSGLVTHPALFAAGQLVSALRAAGVRLPRRQPIGAGRTPRGASLLGTVSSPRVANLIALTNTPSDNFFAEMLIKGLGARFGGAGTTAAGARVVRAELAGKFGIRPALGDGSGLSRADRTSPRQVVSLLRQMASDQAFRASLAVGGETGTLAHEMRGTIAQGHCRGKTGTLSDVANLAGYCQARDGHILAFAFLMNSLGNPAYGHTVEARMAVALANYDG
jgi:D-alanyl-D-alanine carboxypeptidase/D-alanyl-D-alanine-endopeptidase (penicillin-binding protein 4)